MVATEPTFFEGPEKKVEIAVHNISSLRDRGDAYWRGIVEASGARVLSKISNDTLDAYLLSESSLFVADDFVTMITCGQTQLVRAVERLVETLGRECIASLFYERKNEHFPDGQATSFFQDAATLNALIPGNALQFGLEHEHAVRVFQTERSYSPHPDDTTLEILMHGISPDCAATFCDVAQHSDGATHATRLGLLDGILRSPQIDEYCFSPAGYSLNALSAGGYATYHVTPEELGSYVSFETNIDFRKSLGSVVDGVIKHFQPTSFDIVTFTPEAMNDVPAFDNFSQRNHVRELAGGYNVNFFHFFRDVTGPGRAIRLPLRTTKF